MKELGQSFRTQDEKHTWEGQDIEVKGDPLVNDNTGRPIILRVFEFQANPVTLKKMRPNKQELFNSHAMQIKTMLWGDGLQVVKEVPPKIIISKKKDRYQIFVTCELKTGVSLLEQTQTLQDLLKPNAT